MPDESLPALREVIAAYGLRAEKRLGQHFLLDPAILKKIVALAPEIAAGTVLEIGPGPGGLTRALLAGGAERIIAIERDKRCVLALRSLEAWAAGRLQIVEADAVQWDGLKDLEEVTIVANLPYNIATPLLMRWFDHLDVIRSMVLMFQKEVGDRLVAEPGTKAYGRLSVMSQWLCDVRRGFDLPPGAFVPPPQVTSSIVLMKPKTTIASAPARQLMAQLTSAAFGQRRKMLRSSLKSFTEAPLALLDQAGIDPNLRAERLDLDAFLRLHAAARALGAASAT
ncbi:MAG: 16S rRNA (adenine(1518)-N(6)/adenine(1519)-N(6))-dimethyltransferase RsmA, partial [Pseudomonadota bacterium]